jgi:hypothetical protein
MLDRGCRFQFPEHVGYAVAPYALVNAQSRYVINPSIAPVLVVSGQLAKVCDAHRPGPSQLRETLASDTERREPMSDKSASQRAIRAISRCSAARLEEVHTIFEGTSEIQRLVIARAISKMRMR